MKKEGSIDKAKDIRDKLKPVHNDLDRIDKEIEKCIGDIDNEVRRCNIIIDTLTDKIEYQGSHV